MVIFHSYVSLPEGSELEALNIRSGIDVCVFFVCCFLSLNDVRSRDIRSISHFPSSLRVSAQFYWVAMVKIGKNPTGIGHFQGNIMGRSWEHHGKMGIWWVNGGFSIAMFDEDIESSELSPKWYFTYQIIPIYTPTMQTNQISVIGSIIHISPINTSTHRPWVWGKITRSSFEMGYSQGRTANLGG